MFAKLVFALTT